MLGNLAKKSQKKRKYIIWGITIMVAFAPFLSFSIGLTYAFIVRNGWAGLIMWILFPIICILGLIVLLVGVFKEKGTETM
ncbi:hypothetical protein ACFY5J_26280 [Peribacillus butanolivorans]|uniref:hypothetical protein n=1 Tax=Peribacillus butanolivorans TaxID=421767 RepID=UPI0036AFC2E9